MKSASASYVRNAGLAILLSVSPANSARVLKNVMALEGKCTHFEAVDTDLTTQCEGKLGSNIFSDSRSSFTFFIQPPGKRPLVFTFSGVGANEVKQGADAAVQPVDALITNVDGPSAMAEHAVGLCKFTNPYKAGALVACSAETSDGHYEGRFEANGKPPSTMRPN